MTVLAWVGVVIGSVLFVSLVVVLVAIARAEHHPEWDDFLPRV